MAVATRTRAALTLLVATLAGLAAGCGTAAGAAPALEYVALGDSVASGYGLGDGGGLCRRSRAGYPPRVAERLRRDLGPVRTVLLACAGATAAGTGQEGLRDFGRQVDRALETISGSRTLVSVTIGINDLEWWNPLRIAVVARLSDAAFERWLADELGAVRRALRAELRRLLAPPGVRVVVTGYFDPLNERSTFLASPLLCPNAEACRERGAAIVRRLNAALAAAARGLPGRDRIRVVQVAPAFRGHESARPGCGDAPPSAARTWIQDDCFHPDARGASAIAGAVATAARSLLG